MSRMGASTGPEIVAALDATVAAATYEFAYAATDGLPNGLTATTRGYCDLVGPVVAAELTVDIRVEGFEKLVRTWTFTSGTTNYQAASETNDEWVALDSHGVGSTALATLYWLYGTVEATAGDQPGRYAVTISFPAMLTAAPATHADTLRQGLLETRPDLIHVQAPGVVEIVDGRIGRLEVELPAYDGPELALSHPAMLVSLALRPTARRAVEFPETSARMTPETFKNLLMYGEDRPS